MSQANRPAFSSHQQERIHKVVDKQSPRAGGRKGSSIDRSCREADPSVRAARHAVGEALNERR